ncbi:PIN domain-containing protein [Romeria aff. gracilis LEGE 07310]|uniref:PIN domain-containing protein n=1 Tax=Vasconcelosia minhoensis LEGE 07310 TaxID=915328 RepID=A0A8J7DB48_9CYAN|nr:PIN domain-containing protein [Romeria gracilis]MBE9075833.1 PIN domain-containing protein [Romeria aff. gracilis LEGE 07310]
MIIVDTGFWLALVDQKDTYHQAANQAFQKYDEPLVIAWPVMTETCYLLLNRKGIQAQLKFIDNYRQNLFAVFDLEIKHGKKIVQLMQQYANLPMDLFESLEIRRGPRFYHPVLAKLNVDTQSPSPLPAHDAPHPEIALRP